MVVDTARIYVRGGDGGNGVVAFRREKYVPRGGPSGGDGGHGGHVYLESDPGLHTLLDFRYRQHYQAPRGKHGQGQDKRGADGADLVIRVPVGTVVWDQDGSLVVDLTEPGQRVLVARGGRGGRGNARLANPTLRAPRLAEEGQPGEERWLGLELKLLADVGLVGLPNAGKSTLISRISAATPKVAAYPFTTLEPNLGVVKVEDTAGFTVADIPGLIAGAHQGAGLGNRFLRHLERTRVLVHVVDLAAGNGEGDVVANLETVRRELALYSSELASREKIIAANKIDLPGAEAGLRRLEAAYPREEIIPISGATGAGLDRLVHRLAEIVLESKG